MERVPTRPLYAHGRRWAWVADGWLRSRFAQDDDSGRIGTCARMAAASVYATRLGVAALDAATLGCPVDESLELVAMTPAKLEEFSSVEIGGFPAQKGFEAPLDIGATPRREAIAARGNPIITNRPKHSYTSIGAGVTSVEDSWMEARKIFFECRTGTDSSAGATRNNYGGIGVICRAT
jgi:hypothetical protein